MEKKVLDFLDGYDRLAKMKNKITKKQIDPLYPSKDYKEFVDYHKQKGLSRNHWKDLPKMWEDELQFRREMNEALNPKSITMEPLVLSRDGIMSALPHGKRKI